MISNNTTKLETLLNKINELPSNSTPAGWADVSQVTASAGAVMEGEMFVDKNGDLIEGTMPIYSGDEITLDTTNTTHVLDGGYYEDYHVNIALEEKTVTPTDTQQIITPSEGCVLSKVTVEAASSGGGVETVTGVVTIDTLLPSVCCLRYTDENMQFVSIPIAYGETYTITVAKNTAFCVDDTYYCDSDTGVEIYNEKLWLAVGDFEAIIS